MLQIASFHNHCFFLSRIIVFYKVFCIPVTGKDKKCMLLDHLTIVGLFYYIDNDLNQADLRLHCLGKTFVQGLMDLLDTE